MSGGTHAYTDQTERKKSTERDINVSFYIISASHQKKSLRPTKEKQVRSYGGREGERIGVEAADIKTRKPTPLNSKSELGTLEVFLDLFLLCEIVVLPMPCFHSGV